MIYGLFFSLLYVVSTIICTTLKSLPALLKEIFFFDKILPTPSVKVIIKKNKNGGLFAFFSVLLFFIGFLFLSYFLLDGEIRLYMMALSSASLFLFYSAFCDILKGLFVFLFDGVLLLLSVAMRLLITPFKALYYIIKNKFTRK